MRISFSISSAVGFRVKSIYRNPLDLCLSLVYFRMGMIGPTIHTLTITMSSLTDLGGPYVVMCRFKAPGCLSIIGDVLTGPRSSDALVVLRALLTSSG